MHKAWTKLKDIVAFDGWRKVIQKVFVLPDKRQATFDIIKGPDFVTVAAFTKDKKAIILKQFRPGPEKFLFGFPTGNIDEGENALVAGIRELEEESGYKAGKIVFLKKIWTEYRADCQYCFIALDCVPTGKQSFDEDEFIDMDLLTIPELKSLLRNAEDDTFADVAPAYMALDYLEKKAQK